MFDLTIEHLFPYGGVMVEQVFVTVRTDWDMTETMLDGVRRHEGSSHRGRGRASGSGRFLSYPADTFDHGGARGEPPLRQHEANGGDCRGGGSEMVRQPSARTRALVLISTTAVALVLLLSSAVQAMGDGPAPVDAVDYRVRSGDTLWDIAVELGPADRDPRETVHRIQEMNQLDGSMIQPGQVLEIPRPSPADG